MDLLRNIVKTTTVAAEPQFLGAGIGMVILTVIFLIVAISTFAYGHWLVGSIFSVLTLFLGYASYKYLGYLL